MLSNLLKIRELTHLFTTYQSLFSASLILAAPPCKITSELLETLSQRQRFRNNEEMLNMLDLMSSGKMKHPPPLIVRALVDHKNYVADNIFAGNCKQLILVISNPRNFEL